MWDADNDFDEETDRKQFEYEQDKLVSRKRGTVIGTPERQVHKTWNGVPVKTMDSGHIMNSIMYCERKYIEAWSNHKGCHGDKEEFYFKSVYEMFPEYINLRNEWDRRMKND